MKITCDLCGNIVKPAIQVLGKISLYEVVNNEAVLPITYRNVCFKCQKEVGDLCQDVRKRNSRKVWRNGPVFLHNSEE